MKNKEKTANSNDTKVFEIACSPDQAEFISEKSNKKGVSEEAYVLESALNGPGKARYRDKQVKTITNETMESFIRLKQSVLDNTNTPEVIYQFSCVQKGLEKLCRI